MVVNDLFTVLYPLVPLISLIGYSQQIFVLIKVKHVPTSVCLKTWSTWTLTAIITLGYAVFCINDHMLILTCILSVTCHFAIIALRIYKGVKYGTTAELKEEIETFLSGSKDKIA